MTMMETRTIIFHDGNDFELAQPRSETWSYWKYCIIFIDFSSHQESNILVVLPQIGANLWAKKCSLELTNSKQGTNLKSVES